MLKFRRQKKLKNQKNFNKSFYRNLPEFAVNRSQKREQ